MWSFVPSTKIAITKQKIDFWPQISKFWGQKSTFSPLAANWSLTDQCFQHEKGVSLESRYEGTKIFTPCPQKIGFRAQKRPNLAQNWHLGPNIGIFGPLDLMPDQKTMRTSCRSGFLLCWYQNFYLLPQKLGFLAQKRPNLVQNMHFWSFWAKYWHFCTIWARPCRLIQCPVGGRVGGCGARAVSRKTPIYFMYISFFRQRLF